MKSLNNRDFRAISSKIGAQCSDQQQCKSMRTQKITK